MHIVPIWDSIQYSDESNHFIDVISYSTKNVYINKANIELVEPISFRVGKDYTSRVTVDLFKVTMVSGNSFYTESRGVLSCPKN
jgi:hypothetical protein